MKTELNNKEGRVPCKGVKNGFNRERSSQGFSSLVKASQGYSSQNITIIFYLAAAVWLLFPGILPCYGASVLIPLQTCGIAPAAGRNIVLTPVQAQGMNEIPVMDRIQTNTDQNGNALLSLLPGVYQCDVRPSWGQVGVTEFYFYVDPSNAAQNAFANMLTATNNSWPPNQFAWSAQASDARYAPIGVAANAANAVTNTQNGVMLGFPFLWGPGLIWDWSTNSNGSLELEDESQGGTPQWLFWGNGNFTVLGNNGGSSGYGNVTGAVISAQSAMTIQGNSVETNGTPVPFATNAMTASSLNGVSGNQIIQTTAINFVPSAYPGLRAFWWANQYLGNTNGALFGAGNTLGANWVDITGKFSLSNYFALGSPAYVPNSLNGQPGIYFNIAGGSEKQIFVCSNFPAETMISNCTVVAVWRDTLQDGANRLLFGLSAGATGNNPNFGVYTFWASGAPSQRACGAVNIAITNNVNGIGETMGNCSMDILILRFQSNNNGTINEKAWLNGFVIYDTTLTAGGVGGSNIPISGGDGIVGNLFVGATPNNGGLGWQGYLGMLGWYTNAWTDDECLSCALQLDYLYGKNYDIGVLDGASIVNSSGSAVDFGIIEILHDAFPTFNWVETGVGGMGSGTMYTNMVTSWLPILKNFQGRKLVITTSDLGFNDMKWLGLTVANTETNFLNYGMALQSNSIPGILCTPISAQLWDTNIPSLNRTNLISWESNNWQNVGFSALCPLDRDPLVGTNGSSTNLNIYTDGDNIHPGTNANFSMVYNEMVPVFNACEFGNYVVTNGTNLPPLTFTGPWSQIYQGHSYWNSNGVWALNH